MRLVLPALLVLLLVVPAASTAAAPRPGTPYGSSDGGAWSREVREGYARAAVIRPRGATAWLLTGREGGQIVQRPLAGGPLRRIIDLGPRSSPKGLVPAPGGGFVALVDAGAGDVLFGLTASLLPAGTTPIADRAIDLAVLRDGSVAVAVAGFGSTVLRRIARDGTIDPRWERVVPGSASYLTFAPTPDGGVVAAVKTTTSRFFGGIAADGTLRWRRGGTTPGWLLVDGRGRVTTITGRLAGSTVSRLRADGRRDPSWRRATLKSCQPSAVSLDRAGRTLLACPAYTVPVEVVRLRPDGRRDRRFGRGGTALVPLPGPAWEVTPLAVRDTPKGIVIAGGGGYEISRLDYSRPRIMRARLRR